MYPPNTHHNRFYENYRQYCRHENYLYLLLVFTHITNDYNSLSDDYNILLFIESRHVPIALSSYIYMYLQCIELASNYNHINFPHDTIT